MAEYTAEEAKGDPLLKVLVDREKVGENWTNALAQIIEAHEKGCGYVATRKVVHVLIDRYAAAYFPAVVISHEQRGGVIRLLSDRRQLRNNAWLDRFFRYGPKRV